MNYEDMSDWELGLEICKVEMRGQFITYHEQEVDDLLEAVGLNGKSDFVKFKTSLGSEQSFSINDWSRVMPVAVKYGFTIELPDYELGGVGTITKYNPTGTDYQVDFDSNDSVQRAIWICFLKMKDADK
jgi:hypothetical protein